MNKSILVKIFIKIIFIQILLSQNWDTLNGPEGGDVTSFYIDSNNIYWLGTGSSGGIYISKDNGITWLINNKGIGISHVHKIIEVEGAIFAEVTINEDLKNRLDGSVYRKWFQFNSIGNMWLEVDTEDYEFIIIKSEYERWYNNHKNTVNSRFSFKYKGNRLVNLSDNEKIFTSKSNHFPQDVYKNEEGNIFIFDQKVFLLSKSGLFKLKDEEEIRNDDTLDGYLLDEIEKYKSDLNAQFVEKQITPFENEIERAKSFILEVNEKIKSLKESENTQNIDSQIEELRGLINQKKIDIEDNKKSISKNKLTLEKYLKTLSIFTPVSTKGLVATDPRQIIFMSNNDLYVLVGDNNIWKYDGNWSSVYGGYKDYMIDGNNSFISRMDKASNDMILLFEEGHVKKIQNDSISDFFGHKTIINSKTGSRIKPYYYSTQFDQSGKIWSTLTAGTRSSNYYVVRFDTVNDQNPLFLFSYSKTAITHSNRYYDTPPPLIYKDFNEILWVFTTKELFQVGPKRNKQAKYLFSYADDTYFMNPNFVTSSKNNQLSFIEFDTYQHFPKIINTWNDSVGWSSILLSDIGFNYYPTGILHENDKKFWISTGYGPSNPRTICGENLKNYLNWESPGIVNVSEKLSTPSIPITNPWILSLTKGENNEIYVGTSGSGVLKGTNLNENGHYNLGENGGDDDDW